MSTENEASQRMYAAWASIRKVPLRACQQSVDLMNWLRNYAAARARWLFSSNLAWANRWRGAGWKQHTSFNSIAQQNHSVSALKCAQSTERNFQWNYDLPTLRALNKESVACICKQLGWVLNEEVFSSYVQSLFSPAYAAQETYSMTRIFNMHVQFLLKQL